MFSECRSLANFRLAFLVGMDYQATRKYAQSPVIDKEHFLLKVIEGFNNVFVSS